MLEIKKITKTYETESFKQRALDSVSINFRKNEFAAILGPSGSGKTTLLNIIGGLDRYDYGDLIINGISTKKYKDRDWDTYRNHRVGFVFQSYNLIGHQNVLANVELALTLSGIGKKERTRRAKEALEKVGLKQHMKKRPNQLSGGQMQRVAIARALVNDPEILLADEPTGALDTETSKQVMDILKEVAKEKLVIMVTHNPDLAEEYATRIINLKDGKIEGDSDPYDGKDDETKEEETVSKRKTKKTTMKFRTALGLSINNLLTKKGRTILTSFAGAIGIIGIALILSISTGVQDYIDSIEEDTLSSYPITIEAQRIDASNLMEAMNEDQYKNTKKNNIATKDIMGNMITIMSSKIETNDLKTFKEYIDSDKSKLKDYANVIRYSYNLQLQIYSSDTSKVDKLNPSNLFDSFGYGMEAYSSLATPVFSEMLDNKELIESQYEVVAGHMPENYDEVILVVDQDNMISDYTAYTLGLKDKKELEEVVSKMVSGEKIEFEQDNYSFDEILDTKFKVLLNSDYYQKSGNIFKDMSSSESYLRNKLQNALEIKIVGIVKVNEDSVLSSNNSFGNILYTKELTEYVINKVNESEVVKAQRANPEVNVFTGSKFGSLNTNLTNEQKQYLATLSDEEKEEFMRTLSSTSYETNLMTLGAVDIDSPSIIYIYPKDFASKDKIKEIIDNYNEEKKDKGLDEQVISYTDFVGLLMSSVTTIVDIISYVLIAFVSVSLIVSSIMIGIITYISVLERTKEIGILRSIGASKKDISRVFNAETFIVGSLSGIIGVLATLILNIPINIIIDHLAGINTIAQLPVIGTIILVAISMILTMIAGLIPARMASKKDPVVALRTE